jgi:steroid delta-isomerase-like uncharacterized protein
MRTPHIALALVAAAGCATTTAGSKHMSDANKRHIEELYERCFNQGKMDVMDRLVAPDYVGPQGDKGPESFKRTVIGLRTAFPDIHYAVSDVVAEGDRVAVRWRWSGTHKGPFRAFAATGKPFSNTGTAIFHFRDGKIVAAAIETDRLGFLQQLDVVPPDAVLLDPKRRTDAPRSP